MIFYGHGAGDAGAARVHTAAFRHSPGKADYLGRYGSEEFLASHR